MKVIAQRHPADKPGVDVSDPLLTSAPAAIERGRSLIDSAALPNRTTQTVAYRGGVNNGQLVSVKDASQGASWRGLSVSTTIKSAPTGVVITQGIKREQ